MAVEFCGMTARGASNRMPRTWGSAELIQMIKEAAIHEGVKESRFHV
jgi:hypothetical protein